MAWWMWVQLAFDVAVLVWILGTNNWTHRIGDLLTGLQAQIEELRHRI